MQIAELSYDFAKRIVYLHQYLTEESDDREFKMADQVYRSGTSVGANVRESNHAQSAPDFLSKMQIAFKEADEPKERREPLEARLPMVESRLRKTIVKLSTGSHFFVQVIT